MEIWLQVILEWVNCLDVLDAGVKELKELEDGRFYRKLIDLLSWTDNTNILDGEDIVTKFIEEEYPEYKVHDENMWTDTEQIFIASLYLLYTSQSPIFHRPMCAKLQHETQIKIKTFLEMIIPHGKNITRERLKEVIVELEDAAPNTPMTPRTRALKDFFNSPVARSAQSQKIMTERNRELRKLKTELEVERFEKADLQEDLRIQQNKIQNLQKKLQERSAEIKALREEKMRPVTPQSCKKNKNVDCERHYRREIDRLENQLMERQIEMEKLEMDNDALTKKLACAERQFFFLKDKLENCEKTVENLQAQTEVKDRELVNLRITNEELHVHLKEISKTSSEERSFEVDGLISLHSPSSSVNNSEALSSVIDIQLQEAKEESAVLKIQVEGLNEKLKSAIQECEKMVQANTELQEKALTLHSTQMELTTVLNKLSLSTKDIETLKEENASLVSQKEDLENLCASHREMLFKVEESRDVLNAEVEDLRKKVTGLEESLQNENLNSNRLQSALVEAQLRINDNLEHIQELSEANSMYKASIESHNISLKEIILCNSRVADLENNNLDDIHTAQLIEYLKTILQNLEAKCTSKETEITRLLGEAEKTNSELCSLNTRIAELKEKDARNIAETSTLKENLKQNHRTIDELTTTVHRYSTEVARLKQLSEAMQEEVTNKDALLESTAKHVENLERENTLTKELYLKEKELVQQLSECKRKNEEAIQKTSNDYETLLDEFNKEQASRKAIEEVLADKEKELASMQSTKIMQENKLIEKEGFLHDLNIKLTDLGIKLQKSEEELARLESTNKALEEQHEKIIVEKNSRIEELKSENAQIALNIKNMEEKLNSSEYELSNASDQIKLKNEQIKSLVSEMASLKLEKEHLTHIQKEGESKTKSFVQELQIKLLDKQRELDQLNIETKMKEETLDLLRNKFEKLTKESVASELKMEEVIMNLKLVRSNQDAVLKTQEQALQEKCLHLEQLQAEFNKSKSALCKQLDDEKSLHNNLRSTCSNLQAQSQKQMETIEELEQLLQEERKKLSLNKESHRIEDEKKLEICKGLENRVEELEAMQMKYTKYFNSLIKNKEALRDSLQNMMKSREELDISLSELKQKWSTLLTKFHHIFATDKSICDELKHIQAKKADIENTLSRYNLYHLQNMKSLNAILWQKFLWTERKLEDTYLHGVCNKQFSSDSLDTADSDFTDEKLIIDAELEKNKNLQRDITRSEQDIEDFCNLVASFEVALNSDQTIMRSETEKKLQMQIDELIQEKSDVESKLDALRIRNTTLEDHVNELMRNISILKTETAPLAEMKNLQREMGQLKEENSKLYRERDELSKRPKREDVDNQLKDIHNKYEAKLDEMKETMKTAYNDQIAKLSEKQEKSVREKLESLQGKMELQCRKQADKISEYKAHVAELNTQFWNVGEKLIKEKQQKQELLKELDKLKADLQNIKSGANQPQFVTERKSCKVGKKEFIPPNCKEEVFQKVSVVQEKTTFERRYSIRSIQTMGNAFNAEDEEEIFDNTYLTDLKEGGQASFAVDTDRLSTLKRRNALCKPHLKSSYPAEMQFHPVPFTEEEIKTGSASEEVFNDSLSQSLLPEQKTKKKDRTQTSYKKPGPPTPSKNGGKLSLQGNELRSPNSRILRERNKDRTTATPRTLKSLFSSKRQDENSVVTPRGNRRSSIFHRYRSTTER